MTANAEQPAWLCRLSHAASGQVKGAGMLVDDRHVVTCAHVAGLCLGQGPGEGGKGEQPSGSLRVDFPFARNSTGLTAQVITGGWTPIFADGSGDVAVLELADPPPEGAEPAPLRAPVRLLGHRFLVHGFPGGISFPRPAEGDLGAGSGPAGDWVSMAASSMTGHAVGPGYSGAPVWDQTAGAVVGIVATCDDDRTGDMLPLWYLAECWPPLEQLTRWRLAMDSRDRAHWDGRARGVTRPRRPGWYFTGRVAALRELVSYASIQDPSQGQARVVTGEPGAGKSAVLGRLVTLSEPSSRREVPAAVLREAPDGTVPPVGCVDAAIYAAGKTREDVAKHLADAFDLGEVSPDELPDRLVGLGRPVVIVVDALDEASDPNGLAGLLRELADGDIRMILGTRKNLLPQLGIRTGGKRRQTDMVVIDLDDPEFLGPADIRDYVTRVLLGAGDIAGTDQTAGNDLGRSSSPYQDAPALGAQVATAVAQAAGSNFLVAQLIAFDLASDAQPVDVSQAGWSTDFPASLEEAMDKFIDRIAHTRDVQSRLIDRRQSPESCRQWIEDLVTGLAFAEGDGFDEGLWAAAATALGTDQYIVDDVRLFLTTGASVLVRSTQGTGGPEWLIYHRVIADQLRDSARSERSDAPRLIAQALLATVAGRGDGSRDWAAASAYVRRNLAAHAAGTPVLDELIGDPEYVLACDLSRLLLVLDQAGTEEGQTTAGVIASAAAYLGRGTPDAASYLQMIARQHGATAFADRLGRMPGHPLPWSTRWAQVMPRTPHRVLCHHDGRATAITSLVRPDAGRVAVSGGADGVVRVWNLELGSPEPETLGIGTAVRAIVPLPRRDGRPAVVILDQAGTWARWDLTDSPAVPLTLEGLGPCHCMTALQRDGSATVLLGCDGAVVEYDVERDRAVRTISLAPEHGDQPAAVSNIAVLPGAGAGGLLVADLSGTDVAVVDLASGAMGGMLTAPGRQDGDRDRVALIAATRVGDRNVALVRSQGEIGFWDLDRMALIGYANMGVVYGCGAMADGRAVLLATDRDDTFGAWDLSDLLASCRFESANQMASEISDALPVIRMGLSEGMETLSPEEAAALMRDAPASLGLGGPARAIAAIAMGDGRSATVVYAGPSDKRLWSGKPAPPARSQTLITDRAPLPGLPATFGRPNGYMGRGLDPASEAYIHTWILPPPPGRGQRLLGHAGEVTAATLAASVTGDDYLLSAGADGTIRCWRLQLAEDLPHGLAERNERPSALSTASLGDLGPVIITGDLDGQVRIRSGSDGSRVGRPLTGNGYGVRSLATVADHEGTVFAGALHDDLTFRCWDLTARKLVSEVPMVSAFAFTRLAGGQIAVALRSGGDGGTLSVYDIARGRPHGPLTPLRRGPEDIVNVPSSAGDRLFLAEDRADSQRGPDDRCELMMLDVESGEAGQRASAVLGQTGQTTALASLAATSGQQYLLTITPAGVSVWQPGEGAPSANVTPWPSPPDLLSTGRLPEGTAVAVLGLSGEHEFCFLDPDDPAPFGLLTTDSVINALGLSDDGTMIVATESGLMAMTPPTSRLPVPPQRRTTGNGTGSQRDQGGLLITRSTSSEPAGRFRGTPTDLASGPEQTSQSPRPIPGSAGLGDLPVVPGAADLPAALLGRQEDWTVAAAAADALAGLADWVGQWCQAAVGAPAAIDDRPAAAPFPYPRGSLLLIERLATAQQALARGMWSVAQPVLRAAAAGLRVGDREVLPDQTRATLLLLAARLTVILDGDPSADLEAASSLGAGPADTAVIRAWFSRTAGRHAEAAAHLTEARNSGLTTAVLAELVMQARESSSEEGLAVARERLADLDDVAAVSRRLDRLAGPVPPELWLAVAERAATGRGTQLAVTALSNAERAGGYNPELAAAVCELRVKVLADSDADIPARVAALIAAGDSRWDAGQPDIARQHYRAALDLRPDHPEAALKLLVGEALTVSREPVDGSAPQLMDVLARLESAQARYDGDAYAAWSLHITADLHAQLAYAAVSIAGGHMWRSALVIARGLATAGDDAGWWVELARVLQYFGCHQAALVAARRAQALDRGRPPRDDVLNARLSTAINVGSLETVLELMPADVENSPAWLQALAGLVRWRVGREWQLPTDAAIGLLGRAVAADPGMLWARSLLMQAHLLTGEAELARDEAAELLAYAGERHDAEALGTSAVAALVRGDLVAAERFGRELDQWESAANADGDGLEMVGAARLLAGDRGGLDDLTQSLARRRPRQSLDNWQLTVPPMLEALARERGVSLPDLTSLTDVVTRRRAALAGWPDLVAQVASAPAGAGDPVIIGQARAMLSLLVCEADGNWTGARTALHDPASAGPTVPEWPMLADRVLRGCVDSCLAFRDLDQAAAAEEERLARAPDAVSAGRLPDIAMRLAAAGQDDTAQQVLDAARRAGDLPELTRAEGDILWRRGQRAEAGQAWESARAAGGDQLEARLAAWKAGSARPAAADLLRSALGRSYIETATDLHELPLEAADVAALTSVLADVAADLDYAPGAAVAFRALTAPSGQPDLPTVALEVCLSPSWFAGMKNPATDSPLMVRYLPGTRLWLRGTLPTTNVLIDSRLEPGDYQILVLGTVFDEGTMPTDAVYVPVEAIPLLSASMRDRVTDQRLAGLAVLSGGDQPVAGLDGLLVMPAAEIIARRVQAVASAFGNALRQFRAPSNA
jgi:WD40 repeat protein/tetratricopeptide (TPR) repeat protein